MHGVDVAPEVRELSRRLLPEVEALGRRMALRIREEVPFYGEAAVVPYDALDEACIANTRYVLSDLAGEPVPQTGLLLGGAGLAAEAVPYAVMLQGFRVGGRFVWELMVERAEPEIRDVLLLAAADIWAVSDRVATEVTVAYRDALTARIRRSEETRSVLVAALLEGEAGAVAEAHSSATLIDLVDGQGFVVVSAEAPDADNDPLPAVERTLQRANLSSAWRREHHRQEGIVALRRGLDLRQLVERLEPLAAGRVGVSRRLDRLDDAPDGRRQARVASASATPGSATVHVFGDDPLAVLVASNPDQATELVQAVLGEVLELADDDRAVVLETARAWLAANGSTSAAARALIVHRNTVRYRIRRLEELTGRDLSRPVDGASLYVALECARILGVG
ncbi:PucR family transcriptional regulator [Nocardioides sambongensis]|uniref:PucR family transcriptional regulator n=1 Tax=Nocardioides sambongensis TaxID=2589074 RepID=UPI00112E2DCD|nr:helix-turn-helix domain-containing protein [Nocardioides sambongensis]